MKVFQVNQQNDTFHQASPRSKILTTGHGRFTVGVCQGCPKSKLKNEKECGGIFLMGTREKKNESIKIRRSDNPNLVLLLEKDLLTVVGDDNENERTKTKFGGSPEGKLEIQ
jgi:hypothetical protein